MWEGSILAGVQFDPKQVVVQTWQPGSLKRVISAGFKAVDSNYDAWYLDCGGGNWVSGGTSWCAPFKSWQVMSKQSLKATQLAAS